MFWMNVLHNLSGIIAGKAETQSNINSGRKVSSAPFGAFLQQLLEGNLKPNETENTGQNYIPTLITFTKGKNNYLLIQDSIPEKQLNSESITKKELQSDIRLLSEPLPPSESINDKVQPNSELKLTLIRLSQNTDLQHLQISKAETGNNSNLKLFHELADTLEKLSDSDSELTVHIQIQSDSSGDKQSCPVISCSVTYYPDPKSFVQKFTGINYQKNEETAENSLIKTNKSGVLAQTDVRDAIPTVRHDDHTSSGQGDPVQEKITNIQSTPVTGKFSDQSARNSINQNAIHLISHYPDVDYGIHPGKKNLNPVEAELVEMKAKSNNQTQPFSAKKLSIPETNNLSNAEQPSNDIKTAPENPFSRQTDLPKQNLKSLNVNREFTGGQESLTEKKLNKLAHDFHHVDQGNSNQTIVGKKSGVVNHQQKQVFPDSAGIPKTNRFLNQITDLIEPLQLPQEPKESIGTQSIPFKSDSQNNSILSVQKTKINNRGIETNLHQKPILNFADDENLETISYAKENTIYNLDKTDNHQNSDSLVATESQSGKPSITYMNFKYLKKDNANLQLPVLDNTIHVVIEKPFRIPVTRKGNSDFNMSTDSQTDFQIQISTEKPLNTEATRSLKDLTRLVVQLFDQESNSEKFQLKPTGASNEFTHNGISERFLWHSSRVTNESKKTMLSGTGKNSPISGLNQADSGDQEIILQSSMIRRMSAVQSLKETIISDKPMQQVSQSGDLSDMPTQGISNAEKFNVTEHEKPISNDFSNKNPDSANTGMRHSNSSVKFSAKSNDGINPEFISKSPKTMTFAGEHDPENNIKGSLKPNPEQNFAGKSTGQPRENPRIIENKLINKTRNPNSGVASQSIAGKSSGNARQILENIIKIEQQNGEIVKDQFQIKPTSENKPTGNDLSVNIKNNTAHSTSDANNHLKLDQMDSAREHSTTKSNPQSGGNKQIKIGIFKSEALESEDSSKKINHQQMTTSPKSEMTQKSQGTRDENVYSKQIKNTSGSDPNQTARSVLRNNSATHETPIKQEATGKTGIKTNQNLSRESSSPASILKNHQSLTDNKDIQSENAKSSGSKILSHGNTIHKGGDQSTTKLNKSPFKEHIGNESPSFNSDTSTHSMKGNSALQADNYFSGTRSHTNRLNQNDTSNNPAYDQNQNSSLNDVRPLTSKNHVYAKPLMNYHSTDNHLQQNSTIDSRFENFSGQHFQDNSRFTGQNSGGNHSPKSESQATSQEYGIHNPLKFDQILARNDRMKGRTEQTQSDMVKLIKEITRQISLKIDRKKADIQIRVADESIGQIKIKVQIKEDIAKILVITESDESRQMMQKHAPQLKENLAQHGVKVERMDFWTVQERQDQLGAHTGQFQHQSMQGRKEHQTHQPSGHQTSAHIHSDQEEPVRMTKRKKVSGSGLDVMV